MLWCFLECTLKRNITDRFGCGHLGVHNFTGHVVVPQELVTGYHMGHESELLIHKVRDFCEIWGSQNLSHTVYVNCWGRIGIQGVHMKCIPYCCNLIHVLKGTEITTKCILVGYMIICATWVSIYFHLKHYICNCKNNVSSKKL